MNANRLPFVVLTLSMSAFGCGGDESPTGVESDSDSKGAEFLGTWFFLDAGSDWPSTRIAELAVNTAGDTISLAGLHFDASGELSYDYSYHGQAHPERWSYSGRWQLTSDGDLDIIGERRGGTFSYEVDGDHLRLVDALGEIHYAERVEMTVPADVFVGELFTRSCFDCSDPDPSFSGLPWSDDGYEKYVAYTFQEDVMYVVEPENVDGVAQCWGPFAWSFDGDVLQIQLPQGEETFAVRMHFYGNLELVTDDEYEVWGGHMWGTGYTEAELRACEQ